MSTGRYDSMSVLSQAEQPAVTCADCSQVIEGDLHRLTTGRGGWLYEYVYLCEQCWRERFSGDRVYWLANRKVYICRRCRRAVVYIGGRASGYCTEECRTEHTRQLRRERRRVEHWARTCPCGAVFTPRRADARYCSPACRQDAYRRRGAAR